MSVEQQSKHAWAGPALLVGLVWFAAVRIVWNDWRIDPQYGYGMVVPFLSLGLLLKRIPDRPAPMAPQAFGRVAGFSVLSVAVLILALVVPLAEANPDWRPVGLLACLTAVTVSLAAVYLAGGKPWLRHFSFPVCFFLIAVPWPRNFEQSLMGVLMSWNAAATLEILHWLGYEALRQGTMIAIPSGVLGIEEACSGVRSLQSGMMVSLFFGEILRLGPWRRVLLVVTAVAAALTGNVIRSSLLAVVASREGISQVASWHDPAGLLVLLVTFGTVTAFAYRWRGKSAAQPPHPRGAALGHPVPWSSPAFSMGALLMIASLIGTEAWYRMHEPESRGGSGWSLQPVGSGVGASRVTIPPQTMKMLLYPDGFSERWLIGESAGGQSFYFRWPGGRISQQAVAMHRPEVCLSSVGMKLISPLASHVHSSRGITIPFRAWLFRQRGVPVYVFQCILEDGISRSDQPQEPDNSLRGRFRAVLEGRRNRGQRMIEIAFWNLPDQESATAALENYLGGALTMEGIAAPMKR